ncbi:MAG: hypothetical protein ACI38Z_07515 [Parafannyhessea sp.]|uniref:right-handed parallel beta-helix repeat-containing protein n=1 Tax=Parafannyhessea sp. TaxID=2847324 RepID=UPI003F10F070
MSGKTARRLRKERAMGAAAAAAIAVAITPGIAQAAEVTTAEATAPDTTQATAVQTQTTALEVQATTSQAPAAANASDSVATTSAPAAATTTETKSEPVAAPTTSNEPAASTATGSASETGNKQADGAAQATAPAQEGTSASDTASTTAAESASAKAHASLAQNVPAKAPAASAVARVGETDYDDIDAAINAAADGGTVTLLKDVKPVKTFYKSLTITGGHTMTFDIFGWRYNNKLVVDGAHLVIKSDANRVAANNSEAWNWFLMDVNGSISAINGGSIEYIFDSKTGANCAIYSDSGVTVNVDNSTFSIKGLRTKGVSGQGIQLGGTANSGIFVRNGSTFTIDGTNRGYVNSPTVYVEDSTFTVKNCTDNASNGGKFTAIRSTVTFDNNAGHGLSANDTTFDSSTFCSTVNGYSGLDVMGKFNVKNHSFVEVSDNGWHSWKPDLFASIRLRNDATIDGTSTVDVHDNYDVGIHIKKSKTLTPVVTFKPGSKLHVVNNGLKTVGVHGEKAGQEFTTNGGGIWNTGILTLPANAVIYNNNATKSGDDIYSTGTITIGDAVQEGDKYYLDGQQNNVCKDLIDGWYDDSTIKPANPDSTGKQAEPKGGRWVGDIPKDGTTKDIYTKAVKAGTYESSADNPLAIKAAHIYKDSLVYNKNAKDATGTMDPSAGAINDEGRWVKRVSVRKNAFMRAGYKFIGWNTKADGTGTWYGIVDAALAAARDSLDEYDLLDGKDNDVLYAIWEKLPEPQKPTPAKTVTPAPKPAPKHMKPAAVAKTAIPKTGDSATGGLIASILGLVGLGSVGASGMLRKHDRGE